MILFLSVLYFCLVFYSIYLEKNWNNFYARDDFHVSVRFRYTVRPEGGDGAANFAKLDSNFCEPGKHVRTFDMIGVLHVCLNGLCMACEHRWVLRCNVRQPTVCSEVTVISDERWADHVVTWKAVRWYCCSMPVLRHPINSDVNVDWATLPFFPFRAATCFLQRIRFSKLLTSFLVHTK